MMKPLFALPIFLLCIFSSPVAAQDLSRSIEVRSTSPELLETNPGNIVTASFLVSSQAGTEGEFSEELTLPLTWQKVASDELAFRLGPGESQVRVVAFLVPPSADAGRYRIGYSIRSQTDYGIQKAHSLTVVVLPVLELDLRLEDKPVLVIAGENYKVHLRLENQGNGATEINLSAKPSPDCPVKIEPVRMTLKAGESRRLTVEAATDEKLGRKITQTIQITARAEKTTGEVASVKQAASVEIVPRMAGAPDPYFRLPGKASLVGAGQKGKAGLQLELSGWGSLDEEGRRRVDFQFRGPDVQDKSPWGRKDESRISYQNEQVELHLGDRSFRLSPLTQRSAYGRGAQADVRKKRIRFGAFYAKDRWGEPKPRMTGAYLAYRFGDRIDVKGNFLSKNRDSTVSVRGYQARIYSVQTEFDLHPDMKLDLECGMGQGEGKDQNRGFAYRLDLTGRISNRVDYSVEKTRAEPTYLGYYNDADYTSGAVNFRVWRQLRANIFYRSHKNNLEVDSTLGPANREESHQAGLRYSFPSGPEISADYRRLARRDDILPPDYHYEEKAIRLGVIQTFGSLRMNAQVERGEFEDKLLATKSDDLERYSLYASFHPAYRQSLNLYARLGHSSFTGTPERTKSLGLSGSWLIKSNLSVSLDFRRDDSGSSQGQDRSSMISSLCYTFPNEHTILLRSQWLRYDRATQEDLWFFAVYTVPLRIPVGKKKSFGVLKGRVVDQESPTQSPLSRVVLTTDGATAITDDEGEFVFPSLNPGIHYLRAEKGSIGLNRVTTQKQPLAVEVKGGKTTEIQMGVVTSGTISGRVILSAPESDRRLTAADDADSDSLFVVGSGGEALGASHDEGEPGLAQVVVEIADQQEVLRQITDPEGGFSFEDLRPGRWTLKVYENNLPAHHYMERDRFEIDLKPGGEEKINLKVLPRLRPIEIIEEGKIE